MDERDVVDEESIFQRKKYPQKLIVSYFYDLHALYPLGDERVDSGT